MIEHNQGWQSITNEVTTLTIAEITDSSIVLRYDQMWRYCPQKSETNHLGAKDTTMVVKQPQKR